MKPATTYVLFNLLFGLSMGCISPYYVPFLLSVGITLPQVALINTAFFLTIVLMELPTGMLADGRSRTWSVRAGLSVLVLGKLLYSVISDFWGALVCEILIGIALAFISGALEAWVADAVGNNSERLRRVFSGGAMSLSGGILVGGVASALIGSFDLRAGFWLAGFFVLLALVLVWWVMDDAGEPEVRTSELTALRDSVVALKNSASLRWVLIAFMAFALVASFNHYWSPFFRAQVGQTGLSLVWLIIYGGYIVGSYLVRRWAKCQKREVLAVVFSLAVAGYGLLFVGLVGGLMWSLAFAFLHEIGRGAFKPLVDVFVQQRVKSSYRATYGSLQSLVGRLGHVIVLTVVWLSTRGLPDSQGLIVAIWVVQGSLLIIITLMLWFHRPSRSVKSA